MVGKYALVAYVLMVAPAFTPIMAVGNEVAGQDLKAVALQGDLQPILQAANNEGDAEAQYLLGMELIRGEGRRKNLEVAARWFLKAANQGHEDAAIHVVGLALRKDLPKDLAKELSDFASTWRPSSQKLSVGNAD